MDNFRRTVIDVSKHINSDTLKNMKYACKDFIMPAKMGEIKCPLDLLKELEECNKICKGNVQFLIGLLENEEKYDLAGKLAPFNHLTSETSQESFYTEQHQQQPSSALSIQSDHVVIQSIDYSNITV